MFPSVTHLRLLKKKGDSVGLIDAAQMPADADVAETGHPLLDEVSYRDNLRTIEGAIKQYHALLLGWLTKKLMSPEDAADVAQDVYMRVYRFARHTVIDHPQAFLFKVAANLAVNELKRRHRLMQRHVTTADDGVADFVDTIAAEGLNPEDTLDRKQDARALLDAIGQLPDRARTAFVKNRFENKTYAEIAREMGVSESTIEKYMMDALKRLRGRLARLSEGTVLPMPRRTRRGKS